MVRHAGMSAPSPSYDMIRQQAGTSARRHINGTAHIKNKLTLNHAGLAGVTTCATYIP